MDLASWGGGGGVAFKIGVVSDKGQQLVIKDIEGGELGRFLFLF